MLSYISQLVSIPPALITKEIRYVHRLLRLPATALTVCSRFHLRTFGGPKALPLKATSFAARARYAWQTFLRFIVLWDMLKDTMRDQGSFLRWTQGVY